MKVEVEVPDEVMRFLEELEKFTGMDIQDYLSETLKQGFLGDIDAWGESPFFYMDELIGKFGLDKFERREREAWQPRTRRQETQE